MWTKTYDITNALIFLALCAAAGMVCVFFGICYLGAMEIKAHGLEKECAEAALIFKLECLDQDVWDMDECQVMTELHEIDCHKIKGIR